MGAYNMKNISFREKLSQLLARLFTFDLDLVHAITLSQLIPKVQPKLTDQNSAHSVWKYWVYIKHNMTVISCETIFWHKMICKSQRNEILDLICSFSCLEHFPMISDLLSNDGFVQYCRLFHIHTVFLFFSACKTNKSSLTHTI